MALVLPSYEELVRDVQANYFTQLEFPEGLNDGVLAEAMVKYHRFLALPQEVLKDFYMRFDPDLPETDCGLMPSKKGTIGSNGAPVLDDKQYFHYTVVTEMRYGRFCDDHRDARDFFDIAHFIALKDRELFRAFVRTVGRHHPEVAAAYLQSGVPQTGFLRFITYQAKEQDAVSATDHFDRDGYTTALAESEPGLYLGKGPGKPVTHVVHQPNKALLFAGVLAPELDNGAFPMGWHGVKQTSESVVGQADKRTSIVAFHSHRNTGRVSHATTHPHLYDARGNFLGQQTKPAG